MEELVPGWYPDPARGADTYRWWTGSAWTDRLANDPVAPPPDPHTPMRTVPAAEPVRHSARRWATVIASTLAVVLLVAAAAIGEFRQGPARDTVDDPITTAPAPTAAVPWSIGPDRTVRFGDVATARLPGEPFEGPGKPDQIFGFLKTASVVYAETEPAQGGGEAWYANVVSGWVAQDLTTVALEQVAQNLLTALPDQAFSSTTTTTTNVQVGEVPGFGPDEAVRLTARIEYSVPGVEATYDEVVIIVVRTDPVNYAAWLAGVPENAPDQVRAAVRESEQSIVRR